MAGKLYPPYINGTLPAFWLNYDASQSVITGASITIPFSENPTVGSAVSGYKLRLRTASTGSYLFEPIYTVQKDAEARKVTFELTPTQAKKLKEGQYYKAQVAYCGESEEDVGYFSTVGVIKCTSKPTISISNLSLDNINFFTNEFIGLYDMSNCKDQTEKVYSYSFQMFDENGDIYYDTGELLHNSSYDTEYGYSIDRVSINEFVAQDVTYSIQYNVTTLNGLELSTGQYRLTNEGFNSLSRDIQILPKSNLDNGYITINFKGELDKDRSFYYVLNEEFLKNEKDSENNYIVDKVGKTAINKIMAGIMANNSHILYMKTYDLYRYYENGLNQPFIYSSQLKDFQNIKKSITIDNKIYYCNEEIYNNISTLQIQIKDIQEYINNLQNFVPIDEEAQEIAQNHLENLEQLIKQQPMYSLVATGKDLTKSLTYNYVEEHNYFTDETGEYLMTGFGDSYYLIDKEPYEAFYYGAFLLSRASDEDNYSTWMNIERFRLEEQPPSSHQVKDFTIEHGRKYIYALQQYNIWGLYSSRVISDIYEAGFEDAFLYDGERALKIRFNPEISNFKTTILEQKTDTLGGRFPYITRNGDTYYKEFPIGGLIAAEMDEEELFIKRGMVTSHRHSTSAVETYEPTNALRDYHMFSDENIMLERQFKLEVLNWLNDGQPKLFKSPYEGNYIVRLMNTSLTPVKELGRMLHSFSTTAYEIAECNYDNLVRFGFIKTKEPSDFVGLWKTYNLADQEVTENGLTIHFDGGLVSFSIQDMVPGDIVEIIYESGLPATEKIMIGITGAYMCAGINRPISGIHIPLRHLVPDIGDKIQQKMTGVINCYYKGARITKFDAITGMQLKTIPSYQFIGVDPALEQMKRVNWAEINLNSGTFIRTLSAEGFATFQDYTIRDYIDKMIAKQEVYEDKNTNEKTIRYFISPEGQQYINAFDPGDLVSRINATINLGESDKIKLIKLEQGHFRLRELVPVYAQNATDANFKEKDQKDEWLVSVSPYGYPHPIEELMDFEMIDPFCIFEVFQLKDGYWQPVIGLYGSPYYDPYYKNWLYDYEPYFQMNYQEKKISYLGTNEELSQPYKRSDLTLVIDSETGEYQYKNGQVNIPEERIYDIEIQKETIQKTDNQFEDCYYYVDSTYYDQDHNLKENRVYLNLYNYYESLNPYPKGVLSTTPVPNAVYSIKKYDNQIDLSIIKEKHFKDFDNINMIRIGNGIMAELTFQIKVIDYYTESGDAEVRAAKEDYLKQVNFYRNIMKSYAVIEKAYQSKKKNTALMNLYERMLHGKNESYLADLSKEDIEIIRQQLGYTQDKKDLELLTIYQAILLDYENLGSDISNLLFEYFETIHLKEQLNNQTNIENIKNRLDQILIYATSYYDYALIDLNEEIIIAGQQPEEIINLENINDYNYYVYTDWETRESQYYFARKSDIDNYYRSHSSLIKDYIAVDPEGNMIDNINQYNKASIQLLNKVDYEQLYNEVLVALNENDYLSYANQKICLWIQFFDQTSLHEEIEIENILKKGSVSEGAQNKLEIIKAEIEEFNNMIDDLSTQASNIDVEYTKIYNNLIEAVNAYNNTSYFEWGARHLINLLDTQPYSALSLQLIENFISGSSNLKSYDVITNSAVKDVYNMIREHQYNLSQDFEKIRLYDRIIKDKDNDNALDEYNIKQIALSRGKVLECAYECYFSGQKILQILILSFPHLNENTILNAVETYKNIYTIFSNTFKLCLDQNQNIDQQFVEGLIDYYNNLLTEYKNLMAQIKSKWESSEAIDIDQHTSTIILYNELYFLHFILHINHDFRYKITNVDIEKLSTWYYLSPILFDDNSNIIIQKINELLITLPQLFNEENLLTSYVNKNYDLNHYTLTDYNTIDKSWMTDKNPDKEDEFNSYMKIIDNTASFRENIMLNQHKQICYFYYNYPGQGTQQHRLPFSIYDLSFIYNPLMEDQYRLVLTKLPYDKDTQYYIFDKEAAIFRQVILTDGFEDDIEYFILMNDNGYYAPVYNKINDATLTAHDREDQKLFETVKDEVQLYYYDTETESFKMQLDNNLKYEVPYYAHTKVDNKKYFDSLDREKQENILTISQNANSIMSQILNWLLENMSSPSMTNGIIIQKLQDISTMTKIKESLNIMDIDVAKANVKTALNEYNDLINSYQQALKKNSKYNDYLEIYNIKNQTNYKLIDETSGEDIIYSILYSESPQHPYSQDQNYYFYMSDEVFNITNYRSQVQQKQVQIMSTLSSQNFINEEVYEKIAKDVKDFLGQILGILSMLSDHDVKTNGLETDAYKIQHHISFIEQHSQELIFKLQADDTITNEEYQTAIINDINTLTDQTISFLQSLFKGNDINTDEQLIYVVNDRRIPMNNYQARNTTEPEVPTFDTIFLLDADRLKFFSTTPEKIIEDTGIVAWYKELFIDEQLTYYKQLLKEAVELQDLYEKQYTDYQKKYEKYYEAATESNEIYNNYRGTPELEYYLNNDSSKFDELRKGVKEAWWKFLNLLDDKYTAEKERGMYL